MKAHYLFFLLGASAVCVCSDHSTAAQPSLFENGSGSIHLEMPGYEFSSGWLQEAYNGTDLLELHGTLRNVGSGATYDVIGAIGPQGKVDWSFALPQPEDPAIWLRNEITSQGRLLLKWKNTETGLTQFGLFEPSESGLTQVYLFEADAGGISLWDPETSTSTEIPQKLFITGEFGLGADGSFQYAETAESGEVRIGYWTEFGDYTKGLSFQPFTTGLSGQSKSVVSAAGILSGPKWVSVTRKGTDGSVIRHTTLVERDDGRVGFSSATPGNDIIPATSAGGIFPQQVTFDMVRNVRHIELSRWVAFSEGFENGKPFTRIVTFYIGAYGKLLLDSIKRYEGVAMRRTDSGSDDFVIVVSPVETGQNPDVSENDLIVYPLDIRTGELGQGKRINTSPHEDFYLSGRVGETGFLEIRNSHTPYSANAIAQITTTPTLDIQVAPFVGTEGSLRVNVRAITTGLQAPAWVTRNENGSEMFFSKINDQLRDPCGFLDPVDPSLVSPFDTSAIKVQDLTSSLEPVVDVEPNIADADLSGLVTALTDAPATPTSIPVENWIISKTCPLSPVVQERPVLSIQRGPAPGTLATIGITVPENTETVNLQSTPNLPAQPQDWNPVETLTVPPGTVHVEYQIPVDTPGQLHYRTGSPIE